MPFVFAIPCSLPYKCDRISRRSLIFSPWYLYPVHYMQQITINHLQSMLSYSGKSEGAIINLCCVIINLVVIRVVCRFGLQIFSPGNEASTRVVRTICSTPGENRNTGKNQWERKFFIHQIDLILYPPHCKYGLVYNGVKKKENSEWI